MKNQTKENEEYEGYNDYLDSLQQEWDSLNNELIPEEETKEEPILITN